MKAIDYLKSDECPNIKNGMNLNELQLYLIAQVMEGYHEKQCAINGVVSSCVDKETLIEDLNDKRIVGKTIDENIWRYCRKETAEYLLDKYEIIHK